MKRIKLKENETYEKLLREMRCNISPSHVVDIKDVTLSSGQDYRLVEQKYPDGKGIFAFSARKESDGSFTDPTYYTKSRSNHNGEILLLYIINSSFNAILPYVDIILGPTIESTILNHSISNPTRYTAAYSKTWYRLVDKILDLQGPGKGTTTFPS